MKFMRYGAAVAIAGVSAFALTACGSDNNSTTTGSGASNAAADISCAKGSITASGSTAQSNAMSAWIKAYGEKCGDAKINYQANGSSSGIKDFTGGQVSFAGSDSALKDDEHSAADARCKSGKAVDIPMVTGPIAVVYNLEGVDNLQLTAPILAKIFSGKITKWNDPAIAAVNKDAKLPSTSIQAFHRSEGSGTTDNFTKYLAGAAASDWTYDHDKAWKAPGGQGAKGSDGIASAVKSTPGTISYVELSFANLSSLQKAKIQNGAGEYTELTPEAAAKAVAGAKVVGTGDDLALSVDYNTKEAGAYPIVLVTYEIVCEKGTPADALGLVKSFLTYTSSDAGQQLISDAKLGYAPLPTEIAGKVRDEVAKIS